MAHPLKIEQIYYVHVFFAFDEDLTLLLFKLNFLLLETHFGVKSEVFNFQFLFKRMYFILFWNIHRLQSFSLPSRSEQLSFSPFISKNDITLLPLSCHVLEKGTWAPSYPITYLRKDLIKKYHTKIYVLPIFPMS